MTRHRLQQQILHTVRHKKTLLFVSQSTRRKGRHFSFIVQISQENAKISQLTFRPQKNFQNTRQPAPVKHPSSTWPPQPSHSLTSHFL
jgi:hypothetical protein